MQQRNVPFQLTSVIVSILILTATTLYIPVAWAAPSGENSQSNNPLAPQSLPTQYTYEDSLTISPVLSTYIQTSDTDMEVWLNVTISNLINSTLENVLVHDIFTDKITILSSTPLYSMNGSEIAWSMGDFRPYESKNITMKINVDASSTSFTAIDSGFSVFGTLRGGPIYSYADGIVMLPSTFGEFLINTVDADITDTYIVSQAQILSNNPEEIFEFVRDQVEYESYNGSLRGARGTLWSMAGNSMDQSSLLVALLRSNGIPARYAHGTLPNSEAKELIASMFVFPDNVIGSVPEGAETADPVNDTNLLAEVTNHTWVEFYSGDEWVSLDPSFERANRGNSFTTVYDRFAETPDAMRHKVTFKLKVEKDRSSNSYPLTYSASTAEIYGKKIALGHDVSTNEYCSKSFIICTEQTATISYKPYLLVGENKIYGSVFMDEYTTTLLSGSINPKAQYTGEWLEFEVDDLTEISTYERMIFDKIGYVNRKTGAAVTPDTNVAVSPVDIFGMVIAPGDVPSFANSAEMFELYPVFNEMNDVYPTLEGKEWDECTSEQKQLLVDFTTGMTYIAALKDGAASDFTTESLSSFYLTKAYFDSPRIIMVSQIKFGDKSNFGIDLRKNNIRSVLYPGQITVAKHSFMQARGVSEASIEGTVIEQLTNQSAISVPKIFEAAKEQNIPSKMFMPATDGDIGLLINELEDLEISEEDKSLLISIAKITPTYNKTEIMGMDISDEAKYRIIETLESGKGVIIPENMVTIDGITTIGWWEINPETHEIVGVMENGLHFALIWALLIGLLIPLLFDFYVIFGMAFLANIISKSFDYYNALLLGKNPEKNDLNDIVDAKKEAAKVVDKFHKELPFLSNLIDFAGVESALIIKVPSGSLLATFSAETGKKFAISYFSYIVVALAGAIVYETMIKTFVFGIMQDPPLSQILISPVTDFEETINLNTNSVFIPKMALSNSVSASLIIPNLHSTTDYLNLSTTDNATSSLKYNDINLTGADLFDSTNNFIGHYNSININPLSEDFARINNGSNFVVNGNGSLSSYSPSTNGLGMAINWASFNLSTDKLSLEINDGSILADGSTYSGHYTLKADSAEISGYGPMALTFMNSTELDIIGGSVVAGNETSYTGFTGTVTLSEFNQTYDTVDLNGNFDRSLSTHLAPVNTVTDSFTNVTLSLIVESNADDTYEITSKVPEGWGVITNSDGTIKVIPEKGASPGKYRVSVTTVSTTEPELLSTTSAFIEIVTSTGVDADITKEELIYVPVGDNINNGIFSAYQLSITNKGSSDQTFKITTTGIPDEWVLFSRNEITVPAGKTHNVGLYIKPTTIIPQTTTAFTATVTSISDPAITDSVSTDFEMPEYRGVDVNTSPCLLYAVANGSASFDLNVTSQSNIDDTYNITVELPDGWIASYANSTSLSMGESFRQQVSITTDNTSIGEVYFVGVSAGSIFKENASDYEMLSLIVAESVDDTTPPFMTNVNATSITNNSAIITWDTDEMADSLVKYGTESGNYTITASNETNVISHSIKLTGLSQGMTYYYAVNSTDQNNNSAQSTEYNFTTLAMQDAEPPGIINVTNSIPSSTSVTITWDTDEAGDSLIRYGTELGNYTLSASNESFVLEHSITLTGLSGNINYYYVVNSTDQSGNSNESNEYSFTTAALSDTTSPASISDLDEIDQGTTWMLWNWTNPHDPDFNYTAVWINGELKANITSPEHSYNATGLDPDTTYEIGTRTVDNLGNVNSTWVNDTAKTLTPVNQSPISNPNGPYAGTESAAITFDGSGSYDPDDTIVFYAWNFGDEGTGTGVSPLHAYTQDGTYTVTLTVTDNDGVIDTDTTTATVSDTESVADFAATPATGPEPLIVAFTDTSTSYDGITAWEWDFDNDGTVDSTQQNPTHEYAEGTYTVSLTVYEADGDSNTMTKVGYISVTEVQLPVLCPDEYRWNTSISPTGYEWDPFPELFRSWNDVHFINSESGDAFNVTATISYVPVNVNIVDGFVNLGDIPAGSSVWSSDFFELEVDMTYVPLPSPDEGIEWTVEYDDSEGTHHIIENVPQFCATG